MARKPKKNNRRNLVKAANPNYRDKKRVVATQYEQQGLLSKLPVIVDHGLSVFYILYLVSLWFYPQWSGADVVYNMVLILLFEFILVHMSTMMGVVHRGFFFVFIAIILGVVAIIFHTTQINSSAILYLYAVTLINRIIVGRTQPYNFNAFDEGIAKLRHYVACFIIAAFLTRFLPVGGLTESFLVSNGYYDALKMTGMTEQPLMIIQFGIIYYSTSLLWTFWQYLKRK